MLLAVGLAAGAPIRRRGAAGAVSATGAGVGSADGVAVEVGPRSATGAAVFGWPTFSGSHPSMRRRGRSSVTGAGADRWRLGSCRCGLLGSRWRCWCSRGFRGRSRGCDVALVLRTEAQQVHRGPPTVVATRPSDAAARSDPGSDPTQPVGAAGCGVPRWCRDRLRSWGRLPQRRRCRSGCGAAARAAGAAVLATARGCHPAIRRRATLGSWSGPSAAGAGWLRLSRLSATGSAAGAGVGSGCGAGVGAGSGAACGSAGAGAAVGASVFSTANGCHPTIRRLDILISFDGIGFHQQFWARPQRGHRPHRSLPRQKLGRLRPC